LPKKRLLGGIDGSFLSHLKGGERFENGQMVDFLTFREDHLLPKKSATPAGNGKVMRGGNRCEWLSEGTKKKV